MKNPNSYSFIKPERSPVFYGYPIVLLGTLGILASLPGQTIGVSTFTDPVKDALGLTRNEFSNAYMVGTIASSLLLGKAGVWFDKLGARWMSLTASLLLALSLFLCSQSVVISRVFQQLFNTQSPLIAIIVMAVLFFLLRFSGQGVLTMASRNMIMKWFDAYRGRVNAFSSVAVSLGFSSSPLWINMLIDTNGWQKAWIILALGVLGFSFIVLQFFRDNPENHGMVTDGKLVKAKKHAEQSQTRNFTRVEALKTRAFWMYALTISFYSFFITGFTFHVVSIFIENGYTKSEAVAIFIPTSIISVVFSILLNYLSDWLNLKLYLYLMLVNSVLASLGLIYLDKAYGILFLIIGIGVLGGLFAVLNAVSWPRFYGRKHLGAITGRVMSIQVFASALAPSLFSLSITKLASYAYVGWGSLVFLLFLMLASIKANNPQ